MKSELGSGRSYIFKTILPILAVAVLVLAQSCTYDVEEELYPFTGCDTTLTISYSMAVTEVLDVHCYECHAGDSPSAGFVINTYATLTPFVDNGDLLCSIEHGQDCLAMPDDRPKIPECDIDIIRQWIENGALDD